MNHSKDEEERSESAVKAALDPERLFGTIRKLPHVGALIVFGFFAACCVHAATTSIEHLLSGHWETKTALLALASTIIGIWTTAMIWCIAHRLKTVRQHRLVSAQSPRACLVFFVSTQNELREPPAAAGPIAIGTTTLERADLLADAQILVKAGSRWSWEMILRGLAPHREKLATVYFIGSPDMNGAPGSFSQIETLTAFLCPYLPGVKLERWHDAVNFDDIAALDEALRALLHSEKERDERMICFDVTGGRKPTSIAGTLATLNNDVAIQYVETDGDKRALTYDLSYVEPPHVGGH